MEDRAPKQIFDSNTLIEQHADYLFRYALVHLRDRSLAEDAVQETFLAALENYRNFSGQSSVRTWLLAILKHKIVDYFRKSWRQAQFITNEAQANPEEAAEVALAASSAGDAFVSRDWQSDPLAKIERKAFWGLLAKGLSELSPRTATAFTLREIEQLSSRDVCQKMQISEANLWVMLHRARRHLRQCFEGSWVK